MMQRSQCENENVQFVQELAEVDGPFESPININFRDLTKLELPSLCWNRSEVCPQKMKITNTGHTVIVSGKWKCERPYLSGGPLMGKYVFSQIHFHWGPDECLGSEHKICGEGFPLEMHAAHFKTDYMSQENALKEKDGMVVVAYLFKLQNEPNPAFKKIISLLPHIQKPCTSQAIEPRPVMSLINPFTDDYFMYWGSVITPSCAHILLWIICREPLGISREQVEEFRKIMDSGQHPICRNSRDVQPVHKRNVFHVNASRDLENPLLPIKQMLGCFCKRSEETINLGPPGNEEYRQTHDCNCPAYYRNQEEIEEIVSEQSLSQTMYPAIKDDVKWNSSFPKNIYFKRNVYVQSAIITRTPLLAKKIESEMIRKVHHPVKKGIRSEDDMKTNVLSQSVCFFPINKINQIKPWPERRKTRERKKSNSFKAFSNILSSFEAFKHHTFKKLKEIDSINQEIKGIKPFCQNAEDKRWLRNIEKVMTSQKLVTIKKSQNCLGELRKLARGCNFDRIFDNKQVNNRKHQKLIKIKSKETKKPNSALPSAEVYEKKLNEGDNIHIDQATTVSLKIQKLIRSFFEDINDTEEFQKTLKKSLMLKKVENFEKKNSDDLESKGYITQKMFLMGNFGDRFFTDVTTETDAENENVKEVNVIVTESSNQQENDISSEKSGMTEKNENKDEPVVPMRKAVDLSKVNKYSKDSDDSEDNLSDNKNELDSGRFDNESLVKGFAEKNFKKKKKSMENYVKKLNELPEQEFNTELKPVDALANIWNSGSKSLADLKKAEKMIKAKFKKSRGYLRKRKSIAAKISLKNVSNKRSCSKSKAKNFTLKYYNLKKPKRSKNSIVGNSCGEENLTEAVVIVDHSKWKQLMKARVELVTDKSESSDSEAEFGVISPKRRKVKKDKSNKNSTRSEKMPATKSEETIDVANEQMLSIEGVKEVEKNRETCHLEQAVEQSERVSEETSEKYREAITQTARGNVEFKSAKEQQYDCRFAICRTISAEFKNNVEKSKREKVFQEDEDLAKLNLEIPKLRFKRGLVKNKSFSSLTTLSSHSPLRSSHRVFIENLSSRRKCLRNLSDLKKIQLKAIKQEIEVCKKLHDPQKEPNEEEKSVKPAEDRTEATVKPADEELMPTSQTQSEKSRIPLVKRSDGQKCGIPRRRRKEVESSKQKLIQKALEDVQRSEPKKCLQNDKSKDSEHNEENSEMKISTIFQSVSKNSAHKSLSAKNLNSLGKSFRRKNRKRPNTCKRNPKNYIRKSSVPERKPSKVESNPLQKTVVPDENLLKSVSNDLANYFRKSLVSFKHQLDSEENVVKWMEEIMLKNLKLIEEATKETTTVETSANEEKKENREAEQTVEKPEEKTTKPEKNINLPKASTGIPKLKSRLPKPTDDFIKRNIQMAGKYKKASPVTEKQTPAKATVPNSVEKGKKNANQSEPDSKRSETPAGNKVNAKSNGTRIPKSLRRTKFTKQERPASSEAKGGNEENGKEPEKSPPEPSEAPDQKIPFPRVLPAYMMISDLFPPLEIIQNQQKQLNRYSLNTNVDKCVPGLWKENLRKDNWCDFLPVKELEYLLTLQRCVYDEESTRRENSISYVKTLLSQECNEMLLADASTNESLAFCEPLDCFDACNNGLHLIEMTDFPNSSISNSDLSGCFKLEELDNLGHQLKNKMHISKTSQESGDPGTVNHIVSHNRQEWRSDSNYDCQIFITLSSNSNESESYAPVTAGTAGENTSGAQGVSNKSSVILRKSSQSLSLKQQRKKRKETEISPEMKQKLLDILETEIRREIGVKRSDSAETVSEGYALCTLEDLEVNQRSRSAASFDNLEVMAEISEAMRQYLSNFKETDEDVVVEKKP